MLRPSFVAAIAVLALAACGPEAAGRAGGPRPPTELVLTNNDGGGGLRIAPSIQYFVDRVSELSGGELVVRWEPGEWATDGREVAAVAAGEADLGWAGTRGYDQLGVDAFRPLHAPLLVDSYALQRAVLADPVAHEALGEIRTLSVEPLALLGDELTFPASVNRPLDTAEAWAGASVWLLESGAYVDAATALGATPLNTFESGGDIRLMLQTGVADALNTMWIYYVLGADYQHAPYAVPNVTFGPRTLTLFANPDSLGALSAEQRGWIEQAAADTAAWSADHAADRVPGFVTEACTYGARLAFATEATLEQLRRAAAPYVDRLRGDPATAQLTAAIERLATTTADDPALEVPDSCLHRPGAGDRNDRLEPLLEPGPTGELPLGTYRYAVAAEQIVHGQETLAEGAPIDLTVTWTLGDGEWTLVARPDDGAVSSLRCDGWFAVTGRVVQFTLHLDQAAGHCLPLVWTAEWSTDADGNLHWAGAVPGVLVPHFTGNVWRPIGR